VTRRLLRLVLAALTIGATCAVSATGAAAALAPLDAAVPAADRDLPDPFILTTGDGYFAYASTSTYASAVLPIMYSPDLREWQPVGPALPRPPEWADPAQVWAPSVVRTGAADFRLLYNARSLETGSHCLGIARASSPGGPFLDLGVPLRCSEAGVDMIDPEVFVDVDVDGAAWLLWKSAGAAGDPTATIWTQRFDPVSGQFDGEPVALVSADQPWEAPVIEAPSMVRWGDSYALFYSGGTFVDSRYAVGYARCASPIGPCVKTTGPILRSSGNLVGPGGQSLFRDLDGHLRIALHSWSPSPIGAIRALHVAAVLGTASRPIVAGPIAGAFDTAHLGPRRVVSVEGWSFDTSDWTTATAIIDLDGRPTAATVLARPRPDVDTALGVTGARSFVGSVTLTRGRHTICVRPPDSRTPIGCRVITPR
jgi:hypothetical protein